MAVPVRILMSAAAREKLAAPVRAAMAGRIYEIVTPDDGASAQADVAFVSRDVTGFSTKHQVLPDTQRMYDALAAAQKLQWVHIHSAGADRSVYLALQERGVRVLTSSGANAPVVAQTAVLGLLALARRWPVLMAAQREQRWAPLIATGLPRDLQGQTAVIVGWGPVGQEIGRLLGALGLDVVVVRRSGGAPLRDALPRADWLVLACPLTAQTRGMIGEGELALLSPQAHLVNVARGEVVDEPSLIEALGMGRIAGAYLDVFATEPLPADSPLWALPNVIVTPHSAGFSDGNEERVTRMFLDNLQRWAAGIKLD